MAEPSPSPATPAAAIDEVLRAFAPAGALNAAALAAELVSLASTGVPVELDTIYRQLREAGTSDRGALQVVVILHGTQDVHGVRFAPYQGAEALSKEARTAVVEAWRSRPLGPTRAEPASSPVPALPPDQGPTSAPPVAEPEVTGVFKRVTRVARWPVWVALGVVLIGGVGASIALRSTPIGKTVPVATAAGLPCPTLSANGTVGLCRVPNASWEALTPTRRQSAFAETLAAAESQGLTTVLVQIAETGAIVRP